MADRKVVQKAGQISDLGAMVKALAESPRRDNSAYHQAMAQARLAFEQAQAEIGGPVAVTTKAKRKRNGNYVVKWVFKPVKD